VPLPFNLPPISNSLELEPNSTTRTPATDTTYGQAHNNSRTNLPHRNARAEHLDMSRCWDVAIFCPLVVFVGGVRSWCSYPVSVGGVRSRCSCSGVWLLFSSDLAPPYSHLLNLNSFIGFQLSGASGSKLQTRHLTYKALYIGRPAYLADFFQHHKTTKPTHSWSTQLLSVPRHNLSFGSRAFRVSAPIGCVIPYPLIFANLKHFLHSDAFWRHTTVSLPILSLIALPMRHDTLWDISAT